MSLGAALLGGTLIGGPVAEIASGNKAAKAQEQGAKEATALGREQLQTALAITAPFRTAGESVLPGLKELANRPAEKFAFRDPGQFLSQYFQGPEFAALNAQAQDNLLRNQAATGGFRSGATQVGLAEISPLLGIQALERRNQQDLTAYGTNQAALADQFRQRFGLANLGANVATGNANAGQDFASQAGQNAIYAGGARANKFLNQGQAVRGAMTDLTTLGLGGLI